MFASAAWLAVAPRGSGMEIDTGRIDEAVLALLHLGLHDHCRAWKGFDCEAMNRQEKGFISNPASKGSDRVAVMHGKVVESGAAAEVVDRPRHPHTRALLHAVPDIGRALAERRAVPFPHAEGARP